MNRAAPCSSAASCIRESTRRWPTQCRGLSTWPYIIVEVVGSPMRRAVETMSIQVRAGSLPLVSTQRTSSSRISAAVPGSDPSPDSRALMRKSSTDRLVRAVPLTTSMGEKACTCISGTRCLTAVARSKYAEAGRSGSMPPCMHTSVAPRSQASAARSATSSIDSV